MMATPLRVLLIEDSEIDAALVLRQLEKAGCAVVSERVETQDGMKAALEGPPWDIIIADYQLPGFDAPSALAILQEAGCDIPFIVVSGAVGEETAVALMRSGARDYLMKDNLTRLAPVVKRELAEAQGRRERRQAEDLLRLQSTALNAAANAIAITDHTGIIQWTNLAFTRMTGYTPDETIGRNANDLIDASPDETPFYQQLTDTLVAGNVWQGEISSRRKNGEVYLEEMTITPLADDTGQVIQYIAIKQDITDRKRTEERLRSSQERYQRLVELSPDAIYVHRSDRIEFVNQAALELFGASAPEQVLGKSPLDFIHPDYHAVIRERIRQMTEQHQPAPSIEEKIIRLDGTVRDVEVAAALVSDAEGSAVQVILRDITERKQAEQALRENLEQVSAGRRHLRLLSRQLVEVQEVERRQLALELHDELGQMLNSTKISLDMMLMLPPEVAREQLVRAQALVSDLIVRVRRMSLELRPSMLDDMGLLPALRWLVKNVFQQTGIDVTFQYNNLDQRFSPQIEITAYRIIQEALTNVARYAGVKAARVEIWCDEQSLNAQISDRGKGFDPRIVNRAYESSGLSGMRERARMIGGDLAIESEPGKGTTITVQLPLVSQPGAG